MASFTLESHLMPSIFQIGEQVHPPSEIYVEEAGKSFPPSTKSKSNVDEEKEVDHEDARDNDELIEQRNPEAAVQPNEAETPAQANLKTKKTSDSQTNSEGENEAPQAPRLAGERKHVFTFAGYSHSIATEESRDELIAIATDESMKEKPKEIKGCVSVIRSEPSSHGIISADEIGSEKHQRAGCGGIRDIEPNDSMILESEDTWYDRCGVRNCCFHNEDAEVWDGIERRPTKDDLVPFDEAPDKVESDLEAPLQVQRSATVDSAVIEGLSKELVLAQIGDRVVRKSLFDQDEPGLVESAPSDEADNKSPYASRTKKERQTCCGTSSIFFSKES